MSNMRTDLCRLLDTPTSSDSCTVHPDCEHSLFLSSRGFGNSHAFKEVAQAVSGP